MATQTTQVAHPKNTYTLAPVTTTPTTITTLQMEKWVKSLSGVLVTKAQVSLLVHGPNFTVAPRHSPMENSLPLWSKHARALNHMKQKSLEQK